MSLGSGEVDDERLRTFVVSSGWNSRLAPWVWLKPTCVGETNQTQDEAGEYWIPLLFPREAVATLG